MPAYRPPMDRDLQWDEVREVHKYAKFPKDLGGRWNAITSSMNNGMKALMWAVGLSRSYRTTPIIRDCVRESVGGMYVPGVTAFDCYAELTMEPVGAIVKAEVRKGERWRTGYALTEEGEKFRPVVYHTIKYFVDKGLDFYKVFALAHEGAPKTRVDILRTVAKKGDIRREDLLKELDLNATSAIFHLRGLSSIGLLEFESATTHEGGKGFPYILIRPIEELTECYKYDVERVQKTFRRIGATSDNKKPFSYSDIAERGGYTERGSEMILTSLTKQGFSKPVSFRGNLKMSSIKPTQKTTDFCREWVEPIEKALKYEDFSGLAGRPNREYCTAAALSFKKNSPQVRRLSEREGVEILVSRIKNSPGATIRELAKNMKLSISRVQQLACKAEGLRLITSKSSETSKSVKCLYPR